MFTALQHMHDSAGCWPMQIRKLEFLLAHAKLHGHDSIVTIGGAQGNNCVAQAVAAR